MLLKGLPAGCDKFATHDALDRPTQYIHNYRQLPMLNSTVLIRFYAPLKLRRHVTQIQTSKQTNKNEVKTKTMNKQTFESRKFTSTLITQRMSKFLERAKLILLIHIY